MSNNLRVSNKEKLEADITQITSRLTSIEFQLRLQEANIAYGALNEPSDLRTHSAFRGAVYANSYGEEIILSAHPVKWCNPDKEKPIRTPKIGEHTKEIMQEFND